MPFYHQTVTNKSINLFWGLQSLLGLFFVDNLFIQQYSTSNLHWITKTSFLLHLFSLTSHCNGVTIIVVWCQNVTPGLLLCLLGKCYLLSEIRLCAGGGTISKWMSSLFSMYVCGTGVKCGGHSVITHSLYFLWNMQIL